MLTETQKTDYIKLLKKTLTKPPSVDQVTWIKLLIHLKRTQQKPENERLILVWKLLGDEDLEVRELAENILNKTIEFELISKYKRRMPTYDSNIYIKNNRLHMGDCREENCNMVISYQMEEPDNWLYQNFDGRRLYIKETLDKEDWECIEELVQNPTITSITLDHNPFSLLITRLWTLYLIYHVSVDYKGLANFCDVIQHSHITSFHWNNYIHYISDRNAFLQLGQIIRNSHITSLSLVTQYCDIDPALIYMVCEAIAPGSKIDTLFLNYININGDLTDFLALCEALPKSNLRFLSLKITYSCLDSIFSILNINTLFKLSLMTCLKTIKQLPITSNDFLDEYILDVEYELKLIFDVSNKAKAEKQSNYYNFNRTRWESLGKAIMDSSLYSLKLSDCWLDQIDTTWWSMFSEVIHRSSLKLVTLSNNSLGDLNEERFDAFIQFIRTCHVSLNLSNNYLCQWNIEQLQLFFNTVNQSSIPSLNLEANNSYNDPFWKEEKWPIFLNFIREAKTSLSLGSDFLDFISKFNLWPDFFGAIHVSPITSLHIENLQEEKYREYRTELENILEQNARQSLPLHCPIIHSFWKKGYLLTMQSNHEVLVHTSNNSQPDPIEITEEDRQLLQAGERVTAERDHLEIFVPQ